MDDEGNMLGRMPELNIQHLFNKTFKHSPSFVLISLDDTLFQTSHLQPNTNKFGKRSSMEYRSLTYEIKLLGGLSRHQPENDYKTNIPIAYITNDMKYNKKAVKLWKEEESKELRFRDIFHENFIHDIINNGTIPDLINYRLGDSCLLEYDGNHLLSGTTNWTKVPKSTPSNHEETIVTIKEEKKDSSKNTTEKMLYPIAPRTVRLLNRNVSPISSDDESLDLEEINREHIENPKPVGRNIGGAPPGPNKGHINFQEQMSMIRYVIKHNYYSKLKGVWLYKRMSDNKIIPGRTHATLETHMKRVILRKRNFDKFIMTKAQKEMFLPYLRD